ncbi:MAG: GFA family protein [Rhodospirillales bacterium]
MAEKATGGCQCGAVRYELTAPPVNVYVCHCSECRRQSASAFGISVYLPSAAVRLTKGAPKRWTRPGAQSGQIDCYFCGDCGSRLWHDGRDDPTTRSLKGGSLDRPPDLSDAVHIWTKSKLPGVVVPQGARQFPEEPED